MKLKCVYSAPLMQFATIANLFHALAKTENKMVYVDDMNAKYGRMKMCHMVADTHDELMAMADKIGVQRKWLQYPGKHKEHFDICLAKKKLALNFGAKEITWEECAAMIWHKVKV